MTTTSPQSLRVSRLRKLLGPFYVTGVFWYWLASHSPLLLPGRSYAPAAVVFGVVFTALLHNARRAIRYNLEPVLGPCGFWAGRLRPLRTIVEFSRCYGDRYERLAHPERFEVEVEGRETWDQAARSGRGIVLVTAHVGAWDAMSQFAAGGLERPIHVVREEEVDPASQEFVRRLVREQGHPNCHTHFVSGDPTLPLRLREALERGELVALQGDRPRGGGRSVVATLFGRTTDLPVGPAVLARLAGAELLPVFCFRERHYRYRIVFRPPIRVETGGRPGEADAEATRAIGREIEWAIRERPHQWFALARVWHAPGAGTAA